MVRNFELIKGKPDERRGDEVDGEGSLWTAWLLGGKDADRGGIDYERFLLWTAWFLGGKALWGEHWLSGREKTGHRTEKLDLLAMLSFEFEGERFASRRRRVINLSRHRR